jgi:putative glutamine amidotransferase
MNKLMLISLFLSSAFVIFAQKERVYIATAKTNKNIEKYLKEVDPSIELIDFMTVDKNEWNTTLNKCSGLLLSGGLDVHPKNYGLDSLELYCQTDIERDKIELLLLNNAMNDSLPILGICRGMQLLNVFFGGQLCVDIPTFYTNDSVFISHRDPNKLNDVIHPVEIYTNSDLFKILVTEQTKVNSWHHQSVSELSKKMRIGAISPDGIVEAIEWREGLDKRWILGVQWHPERYYDEQPENLLIVKEFVKQLKK